MLATLTQRHASIVEHVPRPVRQKPLLLAEVLDLKRGCPTCWAAPFIFLYDQTVSLSGFLLSQVIAFFYRSPQEPHRDSAIRSLEAHNQHEQLACLYG